MALLISTGLARGIGALPHRQIRCRPEVRPAGTGGKTLPKCHSCWAMRKRTSLRVPSRRHGRRLDIESIGRMKIFFAGAFKRLGNRRSRRPRKRKSRRFSWARYFEIRLAINSDLDFQEIFKQQYPARARRRATQKTSANQFGYNATPSPYITLFGHTSNATENCDSPRSRHHVHGMGARCQLYDGQLLSDARLCGSPRD